MKLDKIIELLKDESLTESTRPDVFEAICLAHNLLTALQPRPIEEAPRDELFIAINDSFNYVGVCKLNKDIGNNFVAICNQHGTDLGIGFEADSFLPLSAIAALMENTPNDK